MSAPVPRPHRVRPRYVYSTCARLSERDWQVLRVFRHVRLVTGRHFDPLCFHDLTGRSQTVVRGRVLHRLVNWRVLQTLERRVGGTGGGSATATYALDTVGAALLSERLGQPAGRLATVPGARFVAHSLAVTDVYAGFVGVTASDDCVTIDCFHAEPDCWYPDGLGGWLKPDAYLVLMSPAARDHWWLEVDRATESLPTLRRKHVAYLSFVERGGHGPGQVVPRVLISVPRAERAAAVRDLVSGLPSPAEQLFVVALHGDAVLSLLKLLRE